MLSRLTFRGRVTAIAAAAVAVTVVAAAASTYWLVRRDLRDQLDDRLLQQVGTFGGITITERRSPPASSAAGTPIGVPAGVPSGVFGDSYFQVIDEDGTVTVLFGEGELPVEGNVLDTPVGERPLSEVTTAEGDHVRVVTVAAEGGGVVQLGRSLDELDATLRRLALALLIVSVAGIAIAVALGRLIAATTLRPIHRLSEAADTIARTGDPDHPIDVDGNDELGRLAISFNTMLGALGSSLRRQRQLVADASHELRTPVSSVRTNVEVLQAHPDLPSPERVQILNEVVGQLSELSTLITDLVEAARDEETEETVGPVDLLDATWVAARQVQGAHPATRIDINGQPSTVTGQRRRIERAITNLLDNAVKWSPPGMSVEVDLGPGSVAIRDHGPGVQPGDVPRLFDRFWRADVARPMPGSGLGLAIVRRIAQDHDATVEVVHPADGVTFILRFPANASG